MRLIDLIRWSVAPDHQTAWIALQTVATTLAFAAAGIYVWFTYQLLKEAAANRKTELMLRIVKNYDDLREEIAKIRSFYSECASQGTQPWQKTSWPEEFDDARFRVSRYFVVIRRLVNAGLLSEEVVRESLDSRAIDLFTSFIDPLDKAKLGSNYRDTDLEFFESLRESYSQKHK